LSVRQPHPVSSGGSGTVTEVSVVTANGLSGTVATATTTPEITLNITALDSTKIADGTVTNTEFQYIGGLTSDAQTQINAKAPTASPTFTGTVTIPTPFTIGAVSMTATGTELNYVDGVTSAIQTQLDAKAPLASPTFTGTVVLPTTTVGGVATLSENSSIALDPAGSADGKYTGITVTGTAGATLAFGDLVYLAVAESRWELTDADAASTSGGVLIGMCVLAAASDGNATNILLQGIIRADTAFPDVTIGAPVYVSTDPGDIQVAQPSGVDDVIRVVGFGLTINEIYFNPSADYITHT